MINKIVDHIANRGQETTIESNPTSVKIVFRDGTRLLISVDSAGDVYGVEIIDRTATQMMASSEADRAYRPNLATALRLADTAIARANR